MTLYLDAIWLLNLLIDASLLLLTAIILKQRIKKWRLFLGALIGSTIVLFIITPYFSLMNSPGVKLLYSIVMIMTVFGYKRLRTFLQALFTFYFSTFLLGGGMLGVHYFFQFEVEVLNGVIATKSSGMGSPISWLFVLIGFPLLWFFSKNRIQEFEAKKIQFDMLADVTISIDQREATIRGLVDSGNQLHDPITKTPVMILDINRVKEFLPREIIEKSESLSSLTESTTTHPWESRLRVVPYRGVGQQHEFLITLRPDCVHICHGTERISLEKVLIGLSHVALSSDDEFDCIIHPKMLLQSSIQSA